MAGAVRGAAVALPGHATAVHAADEALFLGLSDGRLLRWTPLAPSTPLAHPTAARITLLAGTAEADCAVFASENGGLWMWTATAGCRQLAPAAAEIHALALWPLAQHTAKMDGVDRTSRTRDSADVKSQVAAETSPASSASPPVATAATATSNSSSSSSPPSSPPQSAPSAPAASPAAVGTAAAAGTASAPPTPAESSQAPSDTAQTPPDWRLALARRSATVQLYELSLESSVAMPEISRQETTAMAWIDADALVVADRQRNISLWRNSSSSPTPATNSTAAFVEVQSITLSSTFCSTLAFDAESRGLWAGCANGVVRLFSVSAGLHPRLTAKRELHHSWSHSSIARICSPRGPLQPTCSLDASGILCLWARDESGSPQAATSTSDVGSAGTAKAVSIVDRRRTGSLLACSSQNIFVVEPQPESGPEAPSLLLTYRFFPPSVTDTDTSFHAGRLLVTGGAGFIGSAVVRHLSHSLPGSTIIVLDKLDACASRASLPAHTQSHMLSADLGAKTVFSNGHRHPPSAPGVHLVVGDICNFALVQQIMRDELIDTVIHFAAQTHVDISFADSLAFTHNNVLGTHVMLESARLACPRLQRFIHVSTDEVYGETSGDVPREFHEHESPLEPTNPYAASKAAAEMLIKAYKRSYKMPIVVTRGNNVYGPAQYPEKLVPKFIVRVLRGMQLPVHGSGLQKRGFVYVDDVARAFELIVKKAKPGAILNIGTDEELSVIRVAQDICRMTGQDPAATILHVKDRLFQDRRYLMNNNQMEALGWKPQWTWEEGLQATIDWYAAHPDFWHHNLDTALQAHMIGQERDALDLAA